LTGKGSEAATAHDQEQRVCMLVSETQKRRKCCRFCHRCCL